MHTTSADAPSANGIGPERIRVRLERSPWLLPVAHKRVGAICAAPRPHRASNPKCVDPVPRLTASARSRVARPVVALETHGAERQRRALALNDQTRGAGQSDRPMEPELLDTDASAPRRSAGTTSTGRTLGRRTTCASPTRRESSTLKRDRDSRLKHASLHSDKIRFIGPALVSCRRSLRWIQCSVNRRGGDRRTDQRGPLRKERS
jgi:hypothetical protein